MSSKLQKDNKGFTIIEVLIVLAIAGLILLIVFLAVPALQRNSRNTQAKNEAASVLGALSEFTNNNNGKLPADGTSTDGGADEPSTVFGNAKVSVLTSIKIEGADGSTLPTSEQAVIRKSAKCGSFTPGTGGSSDAFTTTAGAGRQVAILYMAEDSAGPKIMCTES